MDHPVLSVAIPTFNRCDLLEFCLTRHLESFAGFGFPYEIVVSDNASTDATERMVTGKIREGHPIRLFRRTVTDASANHLNAYRKCRGSLVSYLADDDSVIAETLSHYVERMQRDRECVGIYTDWVAFDDAEAVELHRYFPPTAAGRFAWPDRTAFVEHLLVNRIMPEIGVWRRTAFIGACTAASLQYPFLQWAYGLLRSGTVEFSMTPFYRENRVLPSRFTRGTTANSTWALGMIGEPMRLALENLVCMLLCDASSPAFAPNVLDSVRRLIEGWLHSRIDLEVGRAAQRQDWILATELRRRLGLWYGIGPSDRSGANASADEVAAAMQRLHILRLAVADITEMLFFGEAAAYCQLFQSLYGDAGGRAATGLAGVDPSRTLIVFFPPADAVVHRVFAEFPGHLVDLRAILAASRVTYTRADGGLVAGRAHTVGEGV